MWMLLTTGLGYKMMKTIQMTLDETLLERIDNMVDVLDTTRSAFIREAVEKALREYHWRELERLDEEGYRLFPQEDSEIEPWLKIQDWGDEWNVEKLDGVDFPLQIKSGQS